MSDPISDQSTITLGLLVGSMGLLTAATVAFVNLRRDVREVYTRMESMVTKTEVSLAFMRLIRDNPDLTYNEHKEEKR